MHTTKTYFFISIIAFLTFLGCTNQSIVGESVLFTTDISEDATPAVLARIMDAENKPISEIKFEKGIYHFYPDKGLEFFVHISNHNDEITRTAFPLNRLNNLTIDGQGSEFIFHGRMIPFLIDNCKNLKITNLSVDWAQPFHTEGLIVAVDEKNNTFDWQIFDDYAYEIRNGQLVFIKEYYEHSIGQAILYDPERKAIAYGTELHTPLTSFSRKTVSHNVDKIQYKYIMDNIAPPLRFLGVEDKLHVEQLKPGLVRIHKHSKKLPPVGKIMVCKGDQWENRLAPAFRVTHTYGFLAQNVNVHHAGGMGIIAENSGDLTLDGFHVTPSNGRMVSTTADATHFVGCRGKVTLKNCTFHNQLDDASNVHGSYQRVVDVLDEYRIGARMGHFQQQGFMIGIPGDTIGLVRLSDSFFPYDYLTIKSIQKINSRYHIITFNEKVPEELQPLDLIENISAYPEFTVQNCDISRNRARGLLLSTPKKTVIENNYFHTEMEALLIPVESGFWYESGSITNLVVRNNTFQDCNHSGFDRGIIRFETDDDNENIAFKNIVIENNKINQFDNAIMEVSNVDGLLFRDNVITQTNTFPQLYPDNPAFEVISSKNIVFENNSYKGTAEEILHTNVEGLKFK